MSKVSKREEGKAVSLFPAPISLPYFRTVTAALALHESQPGPRTLAALHRRVKASAAKRPGIYELLDPTGAVIYVGKSRDLRQRLLSYFTAPWPESKSARLIRCAADLRWRYLPSEFAALLEELRRIQEVKPLYNVHGNRYRASLAFVKVTAGKAPRLVVTESAREVTARYYGPFRGRAQALRGVRTLADLLGLRDCADRIPMVFEDQQSLFDQPLSPLCIRHELGTCLAPCAARVTASRYGVAVRAAAEFLEGRATHPLGVVLDRMQHAAAARQFERAAAWRGRLDELVWLFGAVARLRAAVEALSFVYSVRDESGEGDDRVYLIRRGTIRATAPLPRSPLEREAFARVVRDCTADPEPAPAARTGREMSQLLLLMHWFRTHPEAYEDTSPYERWTHVQGASLQ